MRISELLEALGEIQGKCGDLEVLVFQPANDFADDSFEPPEIEVNLNETTQTTIGPASIHFQQEVLKSPLRIILK